MGMVVMTYKINPDSDVEDVDAESIATAISAMGDDVYDIQSVEVKPLAFGHERR
jgi:translation elongation factor EF-1beta